jgi:uncharacterized protein (TIGR03435 family)
VTIVAPAPGVRLCVAALAAAASLPSALAQGVSGNQQFEVASIRPNRSASTAVNVSTAGNRFTASNVSGLLLVRLAYAIPQSRILGGPDWLRTERFDVVATTNGVPSVDDRRAMLRALLRDRFRLAARLDVRDLPVYALTLARPDGKVGPALKPADADCVELTGARARGGGLPASDRSLCGSRFRPDGVSVGGLTMSEVVAEVLAPQADRPVLDRTGLSGPFDFELTFGRAGDLAPVSSGAGPSIFTAVEEQLGLTLQPTRAPIEVLVIDGAERPAID